MIGRQAFEQWTDTAVFAENIGVVDRNTPSRTLFRSPDAKWIREALLASEFAIVRDAVALRLVPESPLGPDCELLLPDGRLYPVQITEALEPGRCRGDEYKEGAQIFQAHKLGDENTLLDAVKDVSEKKSRKGYPKSVSLLIYVNLSTGYFSDQNLEPILRTGTRSANDAFSTVWVSVRGRIFKCWPA